MKLGTSTNMFNCRRGSLAKPTYAEMTAAAADAGFDVIDIDLSGASSACTSDELASDGWEAAIDAAGEAAAKRGVPIVQSTAPFNPYIFTRGRQPGGDEVMHVREMLRRAAVASGRLGVKWMVVRPLNDTVRCGYDTEVELATNREFYAPVLEECKKAGVGIAFENMYNFSPDDYRRSYCENPEDLIALVDSYGDGSVGVCWDFGHANFVLADQPRALRKLGSRIKTTHVQDNRGAVDSHLIPFVGGNVKWEKIMPCLAEIGYVGDIVLDAPSYTKDFPDALKPSAVAFALEAGRYLLSL